MFFKKKVYPILPTSESDTMTFIQKLDYLEYQLNQLTEKVTAAEESITDLQTAVEGKSTVTATSEGGVIQTITIDGDTLDVPQGTSVSATGSDGNLETLTVDDITYDVPQGGEAGDSGNATVGGNSIAQWRLINDMFFLEIVKTAGTDAFVDKSIGIRLKKGDDYYTGLDGKTRKTVVSWKHSTTWYIAVLQLSIIVDGLGNLTIVDPNTEPTDSEILADLKGLPFTFMNVDVL